MTWQIYFTKQAQRDGVPFEAVDCDSLYGRKGWFRDQLDLLDVEYYADIPKNTRVYLEKPHVHYPLTKRGKPAKQPEILGIPSLVKELIDHFQTEWQTFVLRPDHGHTRRPF